MMKLRGIGILCGLTLLLLTATAWAEGVVVGVSCPITWKASLAPNVREYRLYLTRIKGSYDFTRYVAVPAPVTQSSCQALNMTVDGQYYLISRAIGANNAESPNSNEVAFVRDTSIPDSPTGLVVGN